ncbi:uncharacterized protein LOC131030241 [Cryptomeria japonica]|uniref:uncharacterized protein LOC131030241 n=1 Tax=Cryptomeria japonica TaxID=3369 RepID=UPI0025AC0380|nr:uncharacterized protein LOC131030241 [Cryptomeria japonica]
MVVADEEGTDGESTDDSGGGGGESIDGDGEGDDRAAMAVGRRKVGGAAVAVGGARGPLPMRGAANLSAGAQPGGHRPATAAGGNRPRAAQQRRPPARRPRATRAPLARSPHTAAAPAPPQRRQPPALAPGRPTDQGFNFFKPLRA